MSWGNIEEPEFEEGEAACYYEDDDDKESIDPDISLSYIGKKLENVLGHFQKEFEGGISSEQLGSKYGGYGSFLPMYQRSAPISSHPKTPPRVQNHSTSRSTVDLPIEGGPQNFTATIDTPAFQTRWTSDSCSVHSLNNSKSSLVNGIVKQDSRQVSVKVFSEQEPVRDLVKPQNKKKLTVRIKVGQKNAALYSGLGLTSPSSSMGNSPEGSCGTPFVSQEVPSESLAGILQSFTSLPISGYLLLSPLHEHMLNLVTIEKESIDTKPAASVKGWQNSSVSSADSSAIVSRAEEVLKVKKSDSIEMIENLEQTKHEKAMHSVDNQEIKTLESKQHVPNEVNRSSQSFKNPAGAPESVKQQHQVIPVKKRELNREMLKDLVRGESLKSISMQESAEHEHQETRSSSLEKIRKIRVKSSQKNATFGLDNGTDKGNRVCASLKPESEIYEGKLDTKVAMEHLKLKHVPKVAVHEHDESRIPSIKKGLSQKLSSEGKKKLKGSQRIDDGGFKSGVPAGVKDKKSAQKNVIKVRDSYKDLFSTSVEHVDNQVHRLKRPSGDTLKDSSREGITGKCGVPDTCKERPGFTRSADQGISEISLKVPLDDGVPPSKGMASGVEPAPAPPVLIEENWVGCDRCQKWRLLPYGTKPEHLPDKWLCSMLNWLSGMNRCDISEDETTKALHALYQMPLPETQNNLQNNAAIRPSDQIHQNAGSHYVTHQGKKLKSKETSQTSNFSGPITNSSFTRHPRQEVGNSRGLRDKNQPPPESNLIKKPNAKHLKNSYHAEEIHPNYPEENFPINGDARLKKRIKRERESDQYGQESVKKIKTEGVVTMDNGRPGKISVRSGAGLPTKDALKDNRESNRPRVSIKKPRASLQCSVGSASIDVKICDEMGKSSKRRKLVDFSDGQDYLEIMQSNGNVQDTKVSVEDSGDSEFRADKKLLASESQGKSSRKSRGDTETRILLSGSRVNTVGKSVEKVQQMGKYNVKLPSPVTMEDIEALKKDLGSELPVAIAATSSSSKVSDSRRRRKAKYLEVKGSPVESVSSSPMRTSNRNILSTARMTGSGKDDPKFGDFASVCSPRGTFYGDDISDSNQSGIAMRRVYSASHLESFENPVLENRTRGKGVAAACYSSKERVSKKHFDPILHQQKSRTADKVFDLPTKEDILNQKIGSREDLRIEQIPRASCPEVVGNSNHPLSDESSFKDCRSDSNVSKRDSGIKLEPGKRGDVRRQNKLKHGYSERLHVTSEAETTKEIISTQEEARSGKLQPASESQKGSALNVVPRDASLGGEALEVLKISGTDPSGSSDIKKEASTQSASSALKEAEELRNCADRLKGSGFGFESNEVYFQAALLFLHGAYLLESSNGESNKHGEISQMQIYSSTANICETCAIEYENGQEMASAALAYKCTEVAYMRVVYCKNTSTTRVWHDLQASLQMIPQDESPSSSASDIDNLNNQVAVDKTALGKGNGSLVGNHINDPQNRPNFVQLLDFAKDVNSALEASIKTQSAFAAAANMTLDLAQKKAMISSIKRVIDFGFHDVGELVRLVRHTMQSIGGRGFSGR